MQVPGQAQLLRVFIGEADRHEGNPLYGAIVLKALPVLGSMMNGESSGLITLEDVQVLQYGRQPAD